MSDKAEFEKVIQGLGYVPAWDGDQYLYEEVEVAWQAWQAARAQGGEAVGRICDDGLGAYVELHDDYSFTVGQPVYIHSSASVPERLLYVEDGGTKKDDFVNGWNECIDEMLTSRPYAPEGYTPVRTLVLKWLLGETESFEPVEGERHGAFWWRSRLRDAMLTAAPLPEVLSDVAAERKRQDEKWGGPDHDDQHSPNDFVQLAQDYAGWARVMVGMGSFNKYRRRMVQVAALAVAAIESTDRALDRQNPPAEGAE